MTSTTLSFDSRSDVQPRGDGRTCRRAGSICGVAAEPSTVATHTRERTASVPPVVPYGGSGGIARGVGTRLAMVGFVHQPSQPGYLVDYDPIFYSSQANLVADGHGFIAPYLLDANGNGPHRPSAGHPPLLVAVLAVATRLGARSFGRHRLVVALIGALIVPLLALLGAELGGWRTGVIAAAIAALYPNLWLYDGLLMPEALAGVLIALALLAGIRLQRSGGTSYAVWLGVIIGLAALTARRAPVAASVPRTPGLSRAS